MMCYSKICAIHTPPPPPSLLDNKSAFLYYKELYRLMQFTFLPCKNFKTLLYF